MKSRLGRLAAAVVGLVMAGLSTLSGCAGIPARPMDAEEIGTCVDYTVTPDGGRAWAAMKVSDGSVTLRLVDLSTQTTLEEHEVLTPKPGSAQLFTQDSAVYLVVPAGEAESLTYGVFRVRPGEAPQSLSQNLRMINDYDHPYQWQGRTFFLGKNDQGRNAVMLLQDDKLRSVDLERTYPELKDYLEDVYAHNFYSRMMPVLSLTRYGQHDVYLAPWMTSSGRFPISAEGNPDVNFLIQHYGKQRLLALERRDKAVQRLVTVQAADLSRQGAAVSLYLDSEDGYWTAKAPKTVKSPQLFNGVLRYLDRTAVLVYATKKPSPDSERVLYVYDCKSGSLREVSVDLFGSVFTRWTRPESLAWRSGDVAFVKDLERDRELNGVVMSLKDGTGLALSGELFERIAPADAEEDSVPTDPSATEERQAEPRPDLGVVIGIVAVLALGLPAALLGARAAAKAKERESARQQIALHAAGLPTAVRARATVTSAEPTGKSSEWGHEKLALQLTFSHQGLPRTARAEVDLGPEESVRVGDVVTIDYFAETGRAVVVDDDAGSGKGLR